MKQVESYSAADTFSIGKELGSQALAGQVYCLEGELGVGKTVFTQGFASGLGISEYLYALLFGLVYCVGEVNVIGSAMLLTRAVNFYIPLILTFLLVLIKHVKILKKSSKGVV